MLVLGSVGKNGTIIALKHFALGISLMEKKSASQASFQGSHD